MTRLLLNIDLGERGAANRIDHALVQHADIVNIACGGHAGDAESVAVFTKLAKEHGAQVSTHLSYPDKANFGRQPMDLTGKALTDSLDEQHALLTKKREVLDVQIVKLHGALYHAADTDPSLASELAAWLQNAGYTTAITPDPGALATACRQHGIGVLPEAFVERRYHLNKNTKRAELLSRSSPAACLTALPEALAQAEGLISQSAVQLHPDGAWHTINAGTLCIHSDSPIAEPLAAALAKRLREAAP